MNTFCEYCDKPIDARRQRQGAKYCSPKCATAKQKELYYHYNPPYPGIPKGTVGAISELRVVTDLLAKGYEVFRAISVSSSCDLAILKGGKLLRVEVKTAYRSKTSISHAPIREKQKHDILALVLPDTIIYKPDLSSL